MANQKHIPVLLHECMNGLMLKSDGIYLDGTFGRGGHSRQILSLLGEKGRLIALDRDLSAVSVGKELSQEDKRFSIFHSPFSALEKICENLGLVGKIDGILLDIGVSSPQLDEKERGFSFDKDGPLDMRMDQSASKSAQSVIANYSEKELSYIFKVYGEERFATKVARAIVKRRSIKPFTTTLDLAQLIQDTILGPNIPKNKATRCFQALRIEVNSELEELKKALQASVNVLAPQGRLCVISFHSLEDRIVKNFYRTCAQGEKIASSIPLTAQELEQKRLQSATLDLIGGPIKASAQEIEHNVRARSAILRVASRLARRD